MDSLWTPRHERKLVASRIDASVRIILRPAQRRGMIFAN